MARVTAGRKRLVIPNEVGESGGFHRFDHFEALFSVEGEGFFAENHLAVLNGGHCDVEVRVIWGADIDRIDVIALHEFAPVGLGIGVAPLLGEGFDVILGSPADDLLDGDVIGFKKVLKLGVGIRVGTTHEAVANDADADRCFTHLCDRLE